MALAGKRILVTRPRELAQGLAALIVGAGGEPVLYPAIEILDPADPAPARSRLARAQEFDLVVFVSPTAVRRAGTLRGAPWPEGLRAAALGEGTRRELEAAGLRDIVAPGERADSEALLALPELRRLEGRRVLIVRGAGGRALLGETLAARGARVEYAECYRRARPASSAPRGALDGACVNSGEARENLVALLGTARLRALPLFVPHERVARLARALGLEAPVLAGPSDAQMLSRMVAYFGGAK
jgi:uroporphyrinogen-III synthase